MLKRERERLGYTLQDLADMAGCNRVTVSKIENGTIQDPSLSIAVKLALALGKNVSEMTGGDDEGDE